MSLIEQKQDIHQQGNGDEIKQPIIQLPAPPQVNISKMFVEKVLTCIKDIEYRIINDDPFNDINEDVPSIFDNNVRIISSFQDTVFERITNNVVFKKNVWNSILSYFYNNITDKFSMFKAQLFAVYIDDINLFNKATLYNIESLNIATTVYSNTWMHIAVYLNRCGIVKSFLKILIENIEKYSKVREFNPLQHYWNSCVNFSNKLEQVARNMKDNRTKELIDRIDKFLVLLVNNHKAKKIYTFTNIQIELNMYL